MKKSYILASLLSLSLASCREQFLDLAPIAQANTASFFKTQSDMIITLNGAYGALQFAGQYGQNYVFSEIPSDDTTPVLSGSVTDQDEFDKFYLRTTNPFLVTRWNDGYRGIYRTNVVIDRIAGVTMDETLKKRLVGEAKFLRALMYFNLVRTFGDVPLVLTEITDPTQGYEYGRSPVADVYAQITKDLTDAEAALPERYTGADIGRATRGAAKSLLGKVYMTQRKYAEAATKLKEVVDANTYDLLPVYADLFRPANKNSRESIFEVQYKKGSLGEGSNFGNTYAPENSGNAVIQFGGGGNNRPTPDLEQAFEANDPRRAASFATSYVNSSGTRIDYYYIRKYLDAPTVNGDAEDNFYVLRYADVLLLYAEALNETGRTAEALPLLNRVRKRVGLADKTALSQADMRLALEQERRVELAFEGHRWFDLVRTGRALPVLQAKAAAIGIKTNLTQNNLVFPVPQSQIDINPSKISQNPGY
ncbi:RagB/SusD family nutrient uptake outer membrane protein [Spirosoma sordidisoli]|uniref:RagB/SusD family nutrient uptake outer membrane protein n=1 Tax=Spirosoma sordidisoli TaxID=2502893 RepID=A0A4Q2UG26_9BACT|nr:RagB/SusD family nutrient uptake outer membrane protein [Spirosoma sordidisoli]RYC67956.1 RagB/SusD family nutrient uptake outer membrane protein [Spirosoma sordidisoli]